MAKTVASVSLTQPVSDPNIDEGLTFTMGGQATTASHGGTDYDLHFQWDQGLGDAAANYVDIPASGAALTTADTNPLLNQSDDVEKTITVTGNTAGNYFIRVRTVDHNDNPPDTEDISTSQAVTVTSPGIKVTPVPVTAIAAKIDPSIVLGSTSATPGPASAVGARAGPVVVLGSTTVAPAPAAAIAAKVDPVVIRGSLVLISGPAAVIAAIIDPVVALGSTTAAPVAVSVVVATIDPLVLAGGTFITPGPVGAIGDTVDPIVPMPDVLRWVEKMRHAIPSLKLSHRRIFHVGPRH